MYIKPDFKRYIATETLGAIIGAAGAVGGATINGVASGKMNRRAEKFNREEAAAQRAFSEEQTAKQNAWNYQMWKEATEYDNPVNQRQRLLDAGMNPLYYGLDGNASQSAPEAAQPLGYERAQAPNYTNPVGAGIDAAFKVAQIANIEAQTEKTKTETGAIGAKLPFEVDALRNQVEGSKLDNEAKSIVNKYLDAQQQAELRVKDATVAETDAMIQKSFAEIEKMDYEKTTMMIGWLETQEKILTLQKQRELTDKQMEELSSLISVNNANAKKIGLDVSNYDDVTVIGTASHSMHMGPFSVQEGEPITLAMLKAAREHSDALKEKEKKNKRSPEGQTSATDGSPYNGPIYD